MNYFNHSQRAQEVLTEFHNTDAIVYIEGTENGKDRFFWEKIFKKFCPNKKVTFSPKGGKGEVLAILEKGVANNNFVAIDRDLDDIFKPKLKDNKNLIYTWGYSYENDLYSLDLIFDILRIHIKLSDDKNVEIKQGLKKDFDEFIDQISGYMCVFAEGIREGQCVYPNMKSKSFERLFNGKSFTLNLKEISNCVSRIKNKCCADGKHSFFKNIKFCNGHLLESFFCRLINDYAKENKLTKDGLKELALRDFEKFLTLEVSKYYKQTFSNINKLN